jgi:phage/plasmid-like protein (TIGR03299 family)
MAHELATQENGTIAMAYRAGDAAPWHAPETHPQIVAPGASIDTWAEAAGLNYTVECRPNHRTDGTPIPDSFYIERTDNNHVTGPYIAGQWQPVQNRAILEVADDIRAKYGHDIITAGALFGGAAAWVQLEAGLSADIGDGDTVTSRPLFTVRHTGRDANTFASVQTRVVCNNTLTFALSETNADIFRHDHRVALDPAAVETALGLNAESFGSFVNAAKAMAARALTDAEALAYFRAVMRGTEKTADGGRVIHSEGVRKAFAYYTGQDFVAIGKEDENDAARYVSARLEAIARNVGAGLPEDITAPPADGINPGHDLATTRGTVWGVLNTVTWLADQRPVKNRGTAHNVASNLFGDGTGGALKARAHKAALELMTA